MTPQWRSWLHRALPQCQETAYLAQACSDLCCALRLSLCNWAVWLGGHRGKCPCLSSGETLTSGFCFFVSGAGCLSFLMSKYVLFKETNKQSRDTNSSGFSSFVLNTNKRRVVISSPTISNASLSHRSECLDGARHHRTHRASSNCYSVRLFFSFQNSQCSFKAHLAGGFVYSPSNQHLK